MRSAKAGVGSIPTWSTKCYGLRAVSDRPRPVALKFFGWLGGSTVIKLGMSRGIVVLDEDLLGLYEPLRRLHMRVLVPPAKTPDRHRFEWWLPGRLLITNNQDDFREMAVVHEFGVIQISQKLMADPESLAAQISKEIVNRRLWSNKPFILSISQRKVLYTSLRGL